MPDAHRYRLDVNRRDPPPQGPGARRCLEDARYDLIGAGPPVGRKGAYFARLILSSTHLSTTLARLSSGKLLAPGSVSHQHSSEARCCVSGFDNTAGVKSARVVVLFAVQPASSTTAISKRPKEATLPRAAIVEQLIADRTRGS